MKILGIDEAGRGAVIGSMMIAGVCIKEKKIKIFNRIGVKDSKKLTPNRRAVLYKKIKKISEDYSIKKVTADDIDTLRSKKVNLNEIEKNTMIDIINEINPDMVIVDAVDVNEKRFELEIKEKVGKDIIVKAEHQADDSYLSVAAASILAKVERDREIEKLQNEYNDFGDIGSGYPSDERTMDFVKSFNSKEMPDFIRESWTPVQKIKDDKFQKRLF